jgi:hypothetical protein
MPSIQNFNPPANPTAQVESWKNNRKGDLGVLKYDHLGNEIGVRILPGGTVTLTPMERRINQSKAAPGKDPFLNGSLSPVMLIDSEPDYMERKMNPNGMSDSDIVGLFKLSQAKFDNALVSVTNPLVLERALELADEADASTRKVRALEARIEALAEKPKRVKTFEQVTEDIAAGKSVVPSEER